MGEQDQFYIRDHHESIVSREVWDEAERIRMKLLRIKLWRPVETGSVIPVNMLSAVCVSAAIVDISLPEGQGTAVPFMKSLCGSV